MAVARSRAVASVRRFPSKGRDPPPETRRRSQPPDSSKRLIVEASPYIRRTPAGDAELRTPATGLSVTQRRILTLLDSPGRLRDLALRPMVNTAWLTRDAAQLQKAGLIVFDTGDGSAHTAANAESVVQPPARPLARPVTIAIVAVAASVLVWAGWHFSAAPTVDQTRTGVPSVPTAIVAQPPVSTAEPPVIATRVLRGDPRDATKDGRGASARTSPPATPSDALRPSKAEVTHPIVVEPRVPRSESVNASKTNEPQSAVDSTL